MAPVEHEGWAKPGDKVVLVTHHGRTIARTLDVIRATKVSIWLSNGGTFRWTGRGYDVPGRGTWDLKPDLYPSDDPRVVPILHAQKVRNVHANLKAAVSEFDPDNGTSEQAGRIAKMASRLAVLVAEADR